MNKKLTILLILALFLVSILSVSVFAQQTGGQKVTSSFLRPLADMIKNLGTETIDLPGTYMFGDNNTLDEGVSFLMVVLTFLVVFSLFYAASGKMKVFNEHSGARKAFVIALSLLVVFFSPLAVYIQRFIGSMSFLIYVAYVVGIVLLIYWLWGIFGSGFAGVNKSFGAIGKANAERKRQGALNKKMNQDTTDINRQTGFAKKMGVREKEAIGDLEKLTGDEFKGEENLIARFNMLLNQVAKAESATGPEAAKLKDQLVAEATNLLKIESNEMEVNEEIQRVLKTLKKEDLAEIRALDVADGELKQKIKLRIESEKRAQGNNTAATDEEALVELKKAIKLAVNAEKIYQKMEQLNIAGEKYQSNIEEKTKEIIELLRANAYPECTNYIKEIINDIKVEENILKEIGTLGHVANTANMKSFALIKAANAAEAAAPPETEE